jgi:hypothetical protein
MGLLYRFGKFQTGSLVVASWAEAKLGPKHKSEILKGSHALMVSKSPASGLKIPCVVDNQTV